MKSETIGDSASVVRRRIPLEALSGPWRLACPFGHTSLTHYTVGNRIRCQACDFTYRKDATIDLANHTPLGE